jgi:hypothetical protein
MSVLHFLNGAQSAPVAQTSVEEKRKDYATRRKCIRTLTGRKFSIKVRPYAHTGMTKKFAFE